MVDKLNCRMELGKPLTKEASAIRAEVRTLNGSAIPFKRTKDFAAVVDLREVTGDDALWHMHATYAPHNDKIELLNTGEKKWDEMMTTLSHVYDGNPEDLGVIRVDLCCDLPDVSVPRLLRTVKADYKRVTREFGKIEARDGNGRVIDFMTVAKFEAETFQMGGRPNLVRIYNKTRETFGRYQKAKQRHERIAAEMLANKVLEIGQVPTDNADVNRGFRNRLKGSACRMYPFPSFEKWAGMWEWQVLTRVERQFGCDLPLTISTVRSLRDNAVSFNPFANLRFASPDAVLDVPLNGYSPVEWMAGAFMWHVLHYEGWSYQQLVKFLSRTKQGKPSGNAKRTLEKFAPFVRRGSIGDDGAIDISAAELFERYRESVTRQLAA